MKPRSSTAASTAPTSAGSRPPTAGSGSKPTACGRRWAATAPNCRCSRWTSTPSTFTPRARSGWSTTCISAAACGVWRSKYNIRLGDLEPFEREPGLWDPLVGVSWHSYPNDSFEFHANFDVGGFGVGTDLETSAGARVDWKPFRHFGLTAGYNLLYFKAEHTLRGRTFKVTQTIHGPVVGIGLYF